jgi:hypothetical protein
MTTLTRNNSGEFVARKGIPKDVREAYSQLYGVGWEVRLTLPAHLAEAEAKARLGEWLAEIETRIETLRATAKGKGRPLTQKQAHALAGRWYHWFIDQHTDAPGTPRHWRELGAAFLHAVEMHLPDSDAGAADGPHPEDDWIEMKASAGFATMRPIIAEEARIAAFLAGEGIALDRAAHDLFIDAVVDSFPLAVAVLERRAKGDYSPDPTPQSFPEWRTSEPPADNSLDPWQLWQAFVLATSLAENTVGRWQGVFRKMKADFPGRGAGSLTNDEAQTWITGLVGEERTADTVKAVWLTATRRVFSWGVKNKRITTNPFKDVSLEKPKRITTRHKWFRQDEIALILNATLEYTNPQTATERARRWVPWLLAYTGARAGEITQLRGSDVEEHDGVLALKLTPEAGTIKTGEARWAPIHEHLVDDSEGSRPLKPK